MLVVEVAMHNTVGTPVGNQPVDNPMAMDRAAA